MQTYKRWVTICFNLSISGLRVILAIKLVIHHSVVLDIQELHVHNVNIQYIIMKRKSRTQNSISMVVCLSVNSDGHKCHQEEFEGTKGAIRIRTSKNNSQYNGQKKKDKQRSTKHTHTTIYVVEFSLAFTVSDISLT